MKRGKIGINLEMFICHFDHERKDTVKLLNIQGTI